MTRAATLAILLAALLVPTLAAGASGPPKPEFPASVTALLPGWSSAIEAVGANDTDEAWYPEAEHFLDGAKAAQADGRLRTALYDLETYNELVLAAHINKTARGFSSDAERKSYALDRVNEWRAEASAAWLAYRARLDKLEPDIETVQGTELALYSADLALNAALMMGDHDLLARELQRQSGLDRGYLLAIIRADHTSLLNLQWANDVLDVVSSVEGIPPRLVAENWSAISQRAVEPLEGNVATHLQPLEKVAKEIRENNETTLAIIINIAEQRADRATTISVMFGDARTRGLDVVRDAAHGMNSQLNNTTMELPRSYGLAGIFTADAIDRAIFTNEFVARGQADLGAITAAWSQLDHQAYVLETLAAASPVSPPPTPATVATKPAPGVAVALALALALAVALVVPRRRDG